MGGAALQIYRLFEQRMGKIIFRVARASFNLERIPQRIPLDATAEIFAAAAAQGTFNPHRIVHHMKSFAQAAHRRTQFTLRTAALTSLQS